MALVDIHRSIVMTGGTLPINGVTPAQLSELKQEVDGAVQKAPIIVDDWRAITISGNYRSVAGNPSAPTLYSSYVADVVVDGEIGMAVLMGVDNRHIYIMRRVQNAWGSPVQIVDSAVLDTRVAAEDIPGVSAGIMAAGRLRTWLEANDAEGGPTDFALRLLGLSLAKAGRPLPETFAFPGVAIALLADGNLRTWLEANDDDGGPTDFALERIAAGLGRTGAGARAEATDMSRLAGWGSSTIEGLAPHMTALAAELGIRYHDGGDSGGWSDITLAQMGATPARISGMIPASGMAQVNVAGVKANALNKPWRGIAGGVEGVLTSSATTWTFSRIGSGKAVSLAAEPFLPVGGLENRLAVVIINTGKNDLTNNPALVDQVLANTHRCVDTLAAANPRYLVMGHFHNTDTGASAPERPAVNAVNAALAAAYGSRYLDLSAYITGSQIWTHSGVTPTQRDLDQQAAGNKPPSLSSDALHLNAAGYEAVTRHLILPALQSQFYGG